MALPPASFLLMQSSAVSRRHIARCTGAQTKNQAQVIKTAVSRLARKAGSEGRSALAFRQAQDGLISCPTRPLKSCGQGKGEEIGASGRGEDRPQIRLPRALRALAMTPRWRVGTGLAPTAHPPLSVRGVRGVTRTDEVTPLIPFILRGRWGRDPEWSRTK